MIAVGAEAGGIRIRICIPLFLASEDTIEKAPCGGSPVGCARQLDERQKARKMGMVEKRLIA